MVKALSALIFKASGWTFKSDLPDNLRSFIFIGAPHTSNYDFITGMAVAYFLKRNARFVIKKEWLKFPVNLIMKPAGAIGIDREKLKLRSESTTDAMAGLFKSYRELVLMIAPEATRSPNPHWKTGFYYIAQKAHVPIVLGYGDYEKKIAGTGPVIYPTDFDKDMKAIMKFYQNIRGKKPVNFRLDERFS